MKRSSVTYFTITFLTIILCSGITGNAQDLVPIEIELPPAMFVGTPTNLAIENLEKPLGKPRPPFLAPAGTNVVSLGKSIASTDDFPIIGELEMITDGEKNADDGYFVELGPELQDDIIARTEFGSC